MNSKTVEGLVGARTNVNLMNTPMRIYEEASRRGDTAVMERAIGYAGEVSHKAEEYQVKADKGMEEDAKEAKEKAKIASEKVIQKRREEHEQMEERIEESRDADPDTVEISEEGKAALKDHIDSGSAGSEVNMADAAEAPVTYTKTGETVPAEPEANISVSV